jgi:hypothetical protein
VQQCRQQLGQRWYDSFLGAIDQLRSQLYEFEQWCAITLGNTTEQQRQERRNDTGDRVLWKTLDDAVQTEDDLCLDGLIAGLQLERLAAQLNHGLDASSRRVGHVLLLETFEEAGDSGDQACQVVAELRVGLRRQHGADLLGRLEDRAQNVLHQLRVCLGILAQQTALHLE